MACIRHTGEEIGTLGRNRQGHRRQHRGASVRETKGEQVSGKEEWPVVAKFTGGQERQDRLVPTALAPRKIIDSQREQFKWHYEG